MARVMKAGQFENQSGAEMVALRLRELATQASEVVLDARKQAARILTEAREEGKLLELQAEEKGYSEGFRRGREEGYAAGERSAYQQVRATLAGQASEPAGDGETGSYELVETGTDAIESSPVTYADTMDKAS